MKKKMLEKCSENAGNASSIIPDNVLNKHSKYSRYITVNPLTSDIPFDFKFDVKTIPVRDESLFRIMTFNLNGFPKTLISESILFSIFLYYKPDVLFLQEIKQNHSMFDFVSKLNSYYPGNTHRLFTGSDKISKLNLGIIVNTRSIEIVNKTELFFRDNFQLMVFPRLPLLLETNIFNLPVNFVNLHLISNAHSEYRSITKISLTTLHNYFKYNDFKFPVFIGGDWNIDSHSKLFDKYFPGFKKRISNFHHKSDHFLLLSNRIFPDELEHFLQYSINPALISNLSAITFRQYMSDHVPVILDFPVKVLA